MPVVLYVLLAAAACVMSCIVGVLFYLGVF